MDIVRIHLKISGSDFSDVISSELTYDGAHWSGHVHGIPLGSNRIIDAEAYATDGSILFRGHSTFDLAGSEPAAIELVLHDITPPTVLSNNAPELPRYFSRRARPAQTVASPLRPKPKIRMAIP